MAGKAEKKGKMLSFRLSEEDAKALEAMAWVDGVSVATQVRLAVEELIAQRKHSPEWEARVRSAVARAQGQLREMGEEGVAAALELAAGS